MIFGFKNIVNFKNNFSSYKEILNLSFNLKFTLIKLKIEIRVLSIYI